MKNFLYYTPTRVVFGKGAENDTFVVLIARSIATAYGANYQKGHQK